jgi:hypothetical protein
MASYCLWLVHSYKKCLRVGVWITRLDVTSGGEFFWVEWNWGIGVRCRGVAKLRYFDNDETIFVRGKVFAERLWTLLRRRLTPAPCSVVSHPPKITAGWCSLGRDGARPVPLSRKSPLRNYFLEINVTA